MKKVLLILMVLAVFGCTGGPTRDQATIRLPDVASYRATDEDRFLRGFSNPLLDAGPWVYWFWFDNAVVETEVRNRMGLQGPVRLVPTKILSMTPKVKATNGR